VSTIFGPSGPPPGRAKMTKKVTFRLPCKRRKSLLPENHQKSSKSDKILGELLQKSAEFQKVYKTDHWGPVIKIYRFLTFFDPGSIKIYFIKKMVMGG
jgi:hypothetical protein